MSRKIRAVLEAVVTFASFIVIPLMLPRILPAEVVKAVSLMTFDLTGFLNKLVLVGVAMTLMALASGMVDEASPFQLGVSLTSKVLWLVVTFMVLGLGRFDKLGVTTVSVAMEKSVITVSIDFQLFVYLAILTVLLKIIHSILDFREARLAKGVELQK